MIVIGSTTYTSYRALLTLATDAVFEGELDGLVDVAPGDRLTLDGDPYEVTDLVWQPGAEPQTRVRAQRYRGQFSVVTKLLANIQSEVTRWAAADALLGRLVAIAGGAAAYADLILADIGDARRLPDVVDVLARNGFNVVYTTGADPTLLPVWRTVGATVALTVEHDNIAYQRKQRLGSRLPGNALAVSATEDAKAAAQSVADEMSRRLQAVHDVGLTASRILSTADIRAALTALPAARPATGYTAAQLAHVRTAYTGFAAALAVNDYAPVEIGLGNIWVVIASLYTLLSEYDTHLGAGYVSRRQALDVNATSNIQVAQTFGAMGIYAMNLLNVAEGTNDTVNGADGLALIAELLRAVGSLNADISKLDALTDAIASTPVAAVVAPYAARYVDDTGAEFTFPPGLAGRADVRFLPDIYPDRFTAVVRVMQADAIAQMDAGAVTLTPTHGETTATQYSKVSVDLGLPSGVTTYRVQDAKIRRNGNDREVSLNCAALPEAALAAPPGAVTEYARVRVIEYAVTAEQTEHRLAQWIDRAAPGAVYTDDLRVRAYAEIAGKRLAVRRGAAVNSVELNANSGALPTEDYLYVYGADNFPERVGRTTGRQGSYGAAIVTAGYTPAGGGWTSFHAPQAAGYCVARTGAKNWLIAVAPGAVTSAAESYDSVFVSVLELDANFAIGSAAWQTLGILPAAVSRRKAAFDATGLATVGNLPTVAFFANHLFFYTSGAVWGSPIGFFCTLTDAGIGAIAELAISYPLTTTAAPPAQLNPQALDRLDERWDDGWVIGIRGYQAGFISQPMLTPDGKVWGRFGQSRFTELGQTSLAGAAATTQRYPGQVNADQIVVDQSNRVWRLNFRLGSATAPIVTR